MFGRRRRPILGAAVVIGASRSAARREVQQQAVIQSQREIEIQREVDMRRREEVEQERRTQRAIDEAVKAAVTDSQASTQQSPVAVQPQPPQQPYATMPPMPSQIQDTTPRVQPEPSMQALYPQVPPYTPLPPSLDGRPKSAQGISSTGINARFCFQCGFACGVDDKFCRRCGVKQVRQGD
ncbi:hypothetical protein GE09DRAFT_225520 [Coniochaeta sp. 2T2.1]|nr:hypothetical protein GE09DRAFT_225520 [Coniochaeta sp. 2T2.1]